jgi:hypothetical protein
MLLALNSTSLCPTITQTHIESTVISIVQGTYHSKDNTQQGIFSEPTTYFSHSLPWSLAG